MEFHPVDILIFIINIAVLFILLRIILWKPVNKALSERAGRVRNELDEANKALSDAETLKGEYAQKIDNLEARGREIIRESQSKATEEAELIASDARDKSERLLRDAHERIAEEKKRAVIDAQNEIARLATDMAANILKREVSPDDNKNAVDDFFRESR